MYHFLVPICCFIAFILLLLVSISVPTVKSIYLFYLSTNARDIAVRINFGVWGYCIPSERYSIIGVSRVSPAYCSQAHLGWTLDSTVATYLDVKSLESTVTAVTTTALVLHPIATALTFVTLIVSLFLLRGKGEPHRITSILTLLFGILSVFLTTLIFLIDIIVASVLRSKVRDATDGRVLLSYGNGIWLTLVAAIALWIAIFGACCGIFQHRRQRKSHNTNNST